ncbi:unnamed protein product, partial [Hymenolepis diminuta]|uniref:Uncharacterized protein n=1 Tax=Hymenolepis diminuta TaxID=6216 RepID=A0A0R3SKU7_HYMDI
MSQLSFHFGPPFSFPTEAVEQRTIEAITLISSALLWYPFPHHYIQPSSTITTQP